MLHSIFRLARIGKRFTLSDMDKQAVKSRLLEVVKNNPHMESIKSVAIFGSYVNGTPSEESDVDVLIDFEPTAVILSTKSETIPNDQNSKRQASVELF